MLVSRVVITSSERKVVYLIPVLGVAATGEHSHEESSSSEHGQDSLNVLNHYNTFNIITFLSWKAHTFLYFLLFLYELHPPKTVKMTCEIA